MCHVSVCHACSADMHTHEAGSSGLHLSGHTLLQCGRLIRTSMLLMTPCTLHLNATGAVGVLKGLAHLRLLELPDSYENHSSWSQLTQLQELRLSCTGITTRWDCENWKHAAAFLQHLSISNVESFKSSRELLPPGQLLRGLLPGFACIAGAHLAVFVMPRQLQPAGGLTCMLPRMQLVATQSLT